MRRANAATAAAIVLVVAVAAAAAAAPPTGMRRQAKVELVPPFARTPFPRSSTTLAHKFGNLARIDPAHPLDDDNAGQTLSLFGREDLIAASSDDYRPTDCAPVFPPHDVVQEIVARAHHTSIVIINESHERSEHRGFIAEVATRLRPLGYDTLALETLSDPGLDVPAKYLPRFMRSPQLPYLVDDDGAYLSEAGFGRLGRRAKRLGYHFVPYEEIVDAHRSPLPEAEQIAQREEAQAANLAAYVKAHPAAKLLVHVGYSHALEVPRADGERRMAARLKQKSGIDPLTISQTTCRGGGDARYLAVLPADLPPGSFDLAVDHPAARFARHRPAWRIGAGDRLVGIPRSLWPRSGWRVVEARPLGEPTTSVPMDRVAIRPGEDVALLLPPGRYRLRTIDVRRPRSPR